MDNPLQILPYFSDCLDGALLHGRTGQASDTVVRLS
jgi:hypothetical protein